MELVRGESRPSGQRRDPATTGENDFSPPDLRSFHVSTTPAHRGQKNRSPGSIPLRTVCNPQLDWLAARWLGLMEPARGESFPSGQRRSAATPGEDKVSSPD